MDGLEITQIKKEVNGANILSCTLDLEILNTNTKKISKFNNAFLLIISFDKNDDLYISYKDIIISIQKYLIQLNIKNDEYKFRIRNLIKLKKHGKTNYRIKVGEFYLFYKSKSYKEVFTRWILPNENKEYLH